MGKTKQAKAEKTPAWEIAYYRVRNGTFFDLADMVKVECNNRYPMAKEDWGYIDDTGWLYLNPNRVASVDEWEYIITHCILHLGFEHLRKDRKQDAVWNMACDMVITRFLQESHIGKAPPDFQIPFPFPVKNEEQVYEQLLHTPQQESIFSTMSHGRTDMRWEGNGELLTDFSDAFAYSISWSLSMSLYTAKGITIDEFHRSRYHYHMAQEWFVSSYPLLGAVASAFRLVDDEATVKRMGIPIAAVNAQMQEIYINRNAPLNYDEWQFVLAHEYLHAALRHDLRVENRDPVLWNVACDYVINSWLCEMRIGTPPDGVLIDEQYKNMSAEAVYDAIYQDMIWYLQGYSGDVLYGDGEFWDSVDGDTVDAMYRSALRQGLEFHKERNRGYLPAGLVEEIHALSMPPICWDVELAKWFDEQFSPIEKNRSYSRMSRRQSATPDIPRPAWRIDEQPEEQRIFGVLLDTSGSMERGLLAAALGSIASYSMARDVKHVRVVFCDAAAYDQGVMSPEDIAGAVQVRGRGGTKLQPGIDLLDNDPKFPKDAPLLIITDGGCDVLSLRGRKHAFLIPQGNALPFAAKGPVFRLK